MYLDDLITKCHNHLFSSKVALAYLVSRGINLEEIKKYKIGYTGKFNKNVAEFEENGKEYNKWLGSNGQWIQDRIIFPVYDELGNIKGVESRALDQESVKSTLKPEYKEKFKNLIEKLPPKTVRYNKFYLRKSTFSANWFGLPFTLQSIWDTETVFLTEGFFDCISLLKIYPNCLSSLTANLNDLQIDWLKRYVKKVILVFDTDEKGKKASERISNILEDNNITAHSISIVESDLNEAAVKMGTKDLKMFFEYKMNLFF